MADEKGQTHSGAHQDSQSESGDPGRTPGSAEGDRETVEEDLRAKQGEQSQD